MLQRKRAYTASLLVTGRTLQRLLVPRTACLLNPSSDRVEAAPSEPLVAVKASRTWPGRYLVILCCFEVKSTDGCDGCANSPAYVVSSSENLIVANRVCYSTATGGQDCCKPGSARGPTSGKHTTWMIVQWFCSTSESLFVHPSNPSGVSRP
jgi:hypothetical protein